MEEERKMARLAPQAEAINQELAEISAEIEYLEKELAVPEVQQETGFEHVVVVDNLPVVPKSKVNKLTDVLRKIVSQASGNRVVHNGVHMLFDEEKGKSQGVAFVELKDPDTASAVADKLDNHMLDKKHILKVNRYDHLDEIASLAEEYVEPDPQEYEPKEVLRSWLLDSRPIDQYCTNFGDTTAVFWNEPKRQPEPIYSKKSWTDGFVVWSPLGSYMATVHRQGVQIWGGESWGLIGRFLHHGVKLIQFSPQENYLMTFSPEYKKNDNPNDPQCIIVWDVRTGKKCRGFAAGIAAQWPEFRWSHQDKYFARLSKDAISVYESSTMGLLNKKSIKIPGVRDFCWSPTDDLISCWLPESGDTPARLLLLSIPGRVEVVSKALFNVSDCHMHWQEKGDYLCVKVDRHTKTKKSTFTNFELFRMREKNVPVEVLEHKENIVAFAWEPVGNRFAICHTAAPNQRPDVSFYEMRPEGGVKLLKTLEKRQANHLFWSPRGNFIVLAGMRSMDGGHLEFFNVNDLDTMGTEDHFACSHVAWDPTGRYVTTVVSSWSQQQMENGYNIWSFQGKLIHKVLKDRFYQFEWRPRPPSLLSEEREQYIKKHLKEYSQRIIKEELEEKNKVLRELEEKRLRLIREFEEWEKANQDHYISTRPRRRELWDGDASDEDDGWSERNETVAEIISETVEYY
mmetsp:Transcript_3940/g.10930  ORF Transcript_3940/g.10930 Transcript_3940/m.10930 type:complete len:684 (+) Transcript_3940:77-2128(+)|eukprot:CAMPEP_0119132168 /NCGR_PEP_ID=MMETSP1310-20130426/11667_1 /TAXON_ID=464262 /ORGANISM="Genus nov. species nov., Strain RCC2339" /LENGTH=683 /DNA_ID=CAMNT_0007122785 /DNA_START=22 /DNA_END=2073 /DNA_ORIENTATION=+